MLKSWYTMNSWLEKRSKPLFFWANFSLVAGCLLAKCCWICWLLAQNHHIHSVAKTKTEEYWRWNLLVQSIVLVFVGQKSKKSKSNTCECKKAFCNRKHNEMQIENMFWIKCAFISHVSHSFGLDQRMRICVTVSPYLKKPCKIWFRK